MIDSVSGEAIPDAIIYIPGAAGSAVSDAEGRFTWETTADPVMLTIALLGCTHNYAAHCNTSRTDTIILHCAPVALQEVEIHARSAEAILREAIEKIPVNYPDSAFAVDAFYRHYEKINDVYANLQEAQSLTAFRISGHKGPNIQCSEAVGILALRRSDHFEPFTYSNGDTYKDILLQNPIFHLSGSSLDPKFLKRYVFEISPLSNDSMWTIWYRNNAFITDNHGVDNYSYTDFYGEGFETGIITIDKETMAILSFERRCIRNEKYGYPKYNNFILPDRKYTGEFNEAYLLIRFQKYGAQYYPATILHRFTNTYFSTVTYTKSFTISDYSAWYAGVPVTVISRGAYHALESYSFFDAMRMPYNAGEWEFSLPPFYFEAEQEVKQGLSKKAPLEEQFIRSGEH
ncbi:MAG: hypothetical protein R2794_03310 [Chitinophagales bacterium]